MVLMLPHTESDLRRQPQQTMQSFAAAQTWHISAYIGLRSAGCCERASQAC